jgi:hypothetical protein
MWQPIETAPKDGTPVLLFHKTHGCAEGRYIAGEWNTGFDGDEYEGPVWCFGDDAYCEEIEEGFEEHPAHHGLVTHWMPLPQPPNTNADHGKREG